MGNQQIKAAKRDTYRRRPRDDTSFSLPQRYPTLDRSSLEVVPSEHEDRPRYHSIDYGHTDEEDSRYPAAKSIKSERRQTKRQEQQERVLKKLSAKNEELRLELKSISDELTNQLKRKKFVPKKKGAGEDHQQHCVYSAGLRREMQNGYRQIEMYKRTIEALKGREESDGSDERVKRLQNGIVTADQQIGEYIKKIDGLKKVTKVQGSVIEKDINDDLRAGVAAMKKEADDLKKTLKDYNNRDRQRDVNYKKQQAYLFEVQKKWREVNGDYFPELKKRPQQQGPSYSRVQQTQRGGKYVNPMQQQDFLSQYLKLKAKHQEYHKRINTSILNKNKVTEEHQKVNEQIIESDRIIEALKMKLRIMQKVFKPTKKSLFGYDNYEGTELQSEYNGGVSEIEKEIEEQINQDQFDIKHLIANIPKPARPKPNIEFQQKSHTPAGKQKIPREGSIRTEKSGMPISGQKSQPKKWGSALTRTEEKGRPVRKESAFQDNTMFNGEIKPLIIGVNVWVNKNNTILGMQAIYLNDDQIRYGTKSSIAADGFLQRYDLQSPDYLKNVTGAISHEGYLEYLILYSKQGKVGTFGFKNEGQEQFTFGLSSSERPFRLFGASFIYQSQPRINRIGIEICQQY